MENNKTASLQLTLSLVNLVFAKKGNAKPFQVPEMSLFKRRENSNYLGEGRILPAYARTPLFEILEKRVKEEDMPRSRLDVLGRALYDCKIVEPLMVQAMTTDKLLPHLNDSVPEGTEKLAIGEVLRVHMATNPKASAAYKETKLEPRIKLHEIYDEEGSKADPIGVSVRVIQGVVARMWQETGVSPYELADAIDGSRQLHSTHDKLLAQLVQTNFTAEAVRSALKSARTTEAWTANGIDNFGEVVLFVCNYPLRAIIHHLRKAGAVETYTSRDPNIMRAKTKEYDTLIEAFAPLNYALTTSTLRISGDRSELARNG